MTDYPGMNEALHQARTGQEKLGRILQHLTAAGVPISYSAPLLRGVWRERLRSHRPTGDADLDDATDHDLLQGVIALGEYAAPLEAEMMGMLTRLASIDRLREIGFFLVGCVDARRLQTVIPLWIDRFPDCLPDTLLQMLLETNTFLRRRLITADQNARRRLVAGIRAIPRRTVRDEAVRTVMLMAVGDDHASCFAAAREWVQGRHPAIDTGGPTPIPDQSSVLRLMPLRTVVSWMEQLVTQGLAKRIADDPILMAAIAMATDEGMTLWDEPVPVSDTLRVACAWIDDQIKRECR
jgi:hypothetical protein